MTDAVRGPGAARRRALASPDPAVRLAALAELARGGPIDDADALAVVACVGVAVKTLQRRAADMLCASAAAARPRVVAALRAMLASADADERWGATYALARLGVVDATLVPPLLEALATADGDRRWAAAEILVRYGTGAPAAVVPVVLDALAAGAPTLRKMVLYVLRDLAPPDPAVPGALLAALRDADASVRLAALSALARLAAPPPHACAEALRLVREDPDVGVRRAAMSALGSLGRGDAAAAAAVAAGCDADDPAMRRAAEGARRRLERPV